eukprot:SAG31_NODE_9233_length_1311_cov_17.669142_1_plen_107_part_00
MSSARMAAGRRAARRAPTLATARREPVPVGCLIGRRVARWRCDADAMPMGDATAVMAWVGYRVHAQVDLRARTGSSYWHDQAAGEVRSVHVLVLVLNLVHVLTDFF